jgi:hypothetical protein
MKPEQQNIQELKRLAEAATPGPWIAAGPSFGADKPKYLNEVLVDRPNEDDDCLTVCVAISGLEDESTADMDFIAAASPATVRSLIDRIEQLEAALSAQSATTLTDEQIWGTWNKATTNRSHATSNDIVRFARGVIAQSSNHADDELIKDVDRLLKTIRYLTGIAERGEGRAMREDETVEQFVLAYVKRLEAVAERVTGGVLFKPEDEESFQYARAAFGFSCKRVDNAGGIQNYTLYHTCLYKMQYQLYRNEAEAMFVALAEALGVPLQAAPQAVTGAQDDARDAERYRKLRATTKAVRNDDGTSITVFSPEEFDAAVDAMEAPAATEAGERHDC